MPVIGYIGLGAAGEDPLVVGSFRRGLEDAGFVENRNVVIEYRWAAGRHDRIPELVADLIRRGVALICTSANAPTLAAKAATTAIPIVFIVGLDPVRMGLVSAINRPGGNATGVAFLTSSLVPKSVELVRELLPQAQLVAALMNPNNPNAESHVKDLQAAARSVMLQMQVLSAASVTEIDAAFMALNPHRADALVLTSDPLFNLQRHRIVELAARYRVAVVYPWRDFADIGGLLSYGNSLTDAIRQVGVYAGRILKGEKPADLPVWVPTKFELIVNLKTANALGIAVPQSILVRADEVLE